MTVDELRDNLLAFKGTAIVTIHTVTIPKTLKACPYANARKQATVNGMIGWIYETSVNRQRVREGLEPDFQAFPRKWGKRIRGTPLVEHNGKYYLEMKVQNAQYSYWMNTQEITNEIVPFLLPSGKSRQGVEKEIILRDYALENIQSITYAGVNHVCHQG